MTKRIVFASFFGVVLIAFALWLRGIAPAHFSVPTPKPPPGPNAFDDFARAVSLERDKDLVDGLISRSIFAAPPVPALSQPSPLAGLSAQQTRQVAAENAPAIATLRAGFAHAYFAPPLRSESQLLTYLAPDRGLARLCRFEAAEAARRGDWVESERLSLDALQLGADISEHGAIINDLVGIACNAVGRRTAVAPINHLDSATAAQDAKRLESLSRVEETSTEALTQEKWVEESVLNKVLGSQAQTNAMVNSGYAGGPAVDSVLAQAKVNLMWIRYPKQKIARDYERYMDAKIRTARLPYYAASRAPQMPVPSDPLLRILDPIFAPLLFKHAYVRTFNALLTAQLALRAYKLDHQGQYPPTLAALTPTYLAGEPADAFAPGDAPLRYQPEHGGRSYLLYSIGPDGIDNGGAPIVYSIPSGRPVVQPNDTGDIVANKNQQ